MKRKRKRRANKAPRPAKRGGASWRRRKRRRRAAPKPLTLTMRRGCAFIHQAGKLIARGRVSKADAIAFAKQLARKRGINRIIVWE